MITLKNDLLRARIDPKGAQLNSLFNKATGIEHIWQADPTIWPSQAPNLFPIVGAVLNNQLLIDGQAYPMNRHGFARQSLFTVAESSPTRADFVLRYSEQTLTVYPYKFELEITYVLEDNQLVVIYRVDNLDDKPMFFSVGGHPAFNVPFGGPNGPDGQYEDYFIEFDEPEQLDTHLLNGAGLLSGQTRPVALDENRLWLTKQLFDQDALVFKHLRSTAATLRSRHHDRAIRVDFRAFPYLGIWAKPAAPFVCIEPWLGHADPATGHTDISQKEAIEYVMPGKMKAASFVIEVI
jgi:galactose mutarotase-like enzyme